MPARETDPVAVECLVTAGLPAKDVRDWLQAEPGETTDFPADRRKFSAYWQKGSRLLGRLPPKPPPFGVCESAPIMSPPGNA